MSDTFIAENGLEYPTYLRGLPIPPAPPRHPIPADLAARAAYFDARERAFALRTNGMCERGHCRYQGELPAARPWQCEGWHATIGYELTHPLDPLSPEIQVIRWRMCDKQRAWWTKEQERIRHRKASDIQQKKGQATLPAPQKWHRDDDDKS